MNLRIESGRMVALIGPNGSGKTTLLRCLLGLQKPDSGSVQLLQDGPRVPPFCGGWATCPNGSNWIPASC